ncbi:hypothetical protein [Methanocella arvoryzae]|uniref:Uncharacterized protein n=1 Tax=Methanocella arvoryzae (strain DSM 22066 / NBRC 105507 / MRE50) TaxID=351160 RepID=Q0W748_METAR|nr:hypothetical protein [Methanocella arvoryzae]CAJ35795.1 hypothetical protein RCIX340 [Methanocella arvoryzae MRE50]
MGNDDTRGQVMLTCAFLFAIILVIITLMLNNVIYSNNMAYLGFMGQSGYEQRAIKEATIDEAQLAYEQTGGDPIKFRQYMNDYARAVNSMTVAEGIYITVSPSAAPKPVGGPSTTYQATDTRLDIFEKNFNYTYRITTNYHYNPGGATPTPTPSATPTPGVTKPLIVMGTNKTTIEPDGNDFSLIYVQVTDQDTNLPLENIRVSLHATAGEFQDMLSGSPITAAVTDANGKATFRYLSLVPGMQSLHATNGTVSSNTVIIDCQPVIPPGTSAHPPSVGAPTASHESKKKGQVIFEYITVKVPVTVDPGTYDFDDFTVKVSIAGATNLELLSSGDISGIYEKHGIDGPEGYSKTVSARLHWIDPATPYSVTLNIEITAIDKIANVAYSYTTTRTYSGPPPS